MAISRGLEGFIPYPRGKEESFWRGKIGGGKKPEKPGNPPKDFEARCQNSEKTRPGQGPA